MNAFQKQLLLKDNHSMAELDNPERDGIGQPLSPSKVSVEEFETEILRATQEGDMLILATDTPIETPQGWQRVK